MNTCLPHLPYSEVDAFHLQLNPMQATEYYSKLIKEKAPQKKIRIQIWIHFSQMWKHNFEMLIVFDA